MTDYRRLNLNVGTIPNDGQGDALRDAMIGINTNFQNLFEGVAQKPDGSLSLAAGVSEESLAANLANYQKTNILGGTQHLTANVIKLTSNNALYLGGSPAADFQKISTVNTAIADYMDSTASGTKNVNVGSLAARKDSYFDKDVYIGGNLHINGETTFINTTVITTNDKQFILANNAATATLANQTGIIVGIYANLMYNDSKSSWQSNVNFTPATDGTLALGATDRKWNLYSNNINTTMMSASGNVMISTYLHTGDKYGNVTTASLGGVSINAIVTAVGNGIVNTVISSSGLTVKTGTNTVTVNSSSILAGNNTVNTILASNGLNIRYPSGYFSIDSSMNLATTGDVNIVNKTLWIDSGTVRGYLDTTTDSMGGVAITNTGIGIGNAVSFSRLDSIGLQVNNYGDSTAGGGLRANTSGVYVGNSSVNSDLTTDGLNIVSDTSTVTVSSSEIAYGLYLESTGGIITNSTGFYTGNTYYDVALKHNGLTITNNDSASSPYSVLSAENIIFYDGTGGSVTLSGEATTNYGEYGCSAIASVGGSVVNVTHIAVGNSIANVILTEDTISVGTDTYIDSTSVSSISVTSNELVGFYYLGVSPEDMSIYGSTTGVGAHIANALMFGIGNNTSNSQLTNSGLRFGNTLNTSGVTRSGNFNGSTGINISTDVITITTQAGGNFVVGEKVIYKSILTAAPAGLVNNNIYYIKTVTGGTAVTLSPTADLATRVDITASGTSDLGHYLLSAEKTTSVNSTAIIMKNPTNADDQYFEIGNYFTAANKGFRANSSTFAMGNTSSWIFANTTYLRAENIVAGTGAGTTGGTLSTSYVTLGSTGVNAPAVNINALSFSIGAAGSRTFNATATGVDATAFTSGSSFTADSAKIFSSGYLQISSLSTTGYGTAVGGLKANTTGLYIGNTTVSASYTATGVSVPIATASVLGGVKVGTGLAVDGTGLLSATATAYTLPTASTSVLGGVKLGNGLRLYGASSDTLGVGKLEFINATTGFISILTSIVFVYYNTSQVTLTLPTIPAGAQYDGHMIWIHNNGSQNILSASSNIILRTGHSTVPGTTIISPLGSTGYNTLLCWISSATGGIGAWYEIAGNH